VEQQRRSPLGPDAPIGLRRSARPEAQDDQVQQEEPRDGVDVTKSGRLSVAVNDGRFGFTGDDLAENAGVCHAGFYPC
jgi:hypothetical protein